MPKLIDKLHVNVPVYNCMIDALGISRSGKRGVKQHEVNRKLSRYTRMKIINKGLSCPKPRDYHHRTRE